ncbi:MAG: peptidoglycan-N-acetylglucosamine deacetylase [Clostridia bacterium]|nr:peptidoglycan-N-acetylglucosamine deacetylase [Clostridia bacterium]
MRRHLHPVRRIERVAPPPGRRVVAMTFDDGPCAGPARPGDGQGLTESLLKTLEQYGARGTFDIIGTTAFNYPDREGHLHTARWSGVKHDHYPEFGRDELAGAANQPGLVRQILDGGHELANHGYHHVAFGPSRFIYGSREFLPNLAAVIEDLKQLHQLIEHSFGYRLKLARPPHYIDHTADGYSAYHAYCAMGYLYLAASFDGGGWKPSCGDYRKDVENMVTPLARALAADPDSLNGQIIFQKDGYNMSKQSPVCDALPRQLELLKRYDYRVVTVSELLSLSPYTDLDPSHPVAEKIRQLERVGFVLAYMDNSFQPERLLTRGELAVMLLKPGLEEMKEVRAKLGTCRQNDNSPAFKDVPPQNPYAAAISRTAALGLIQARGELFYPDRTASWQEIKEAAIALCRLLKLSLPTPTVPSHERPVNRLAALEVLAPYLLAL